MSIELRRADGVALRGWTSASVTAGVEQIARSFQATLAVSDGSDALEVLAGDAVEVWADDTPLLTGYIDEIAPDYDGESDTVVITGRSATQDAIDSSAPPLALRGVTLRTLADALCSPYGVEVFDGAGVTTPIARAKPAVGEGVGDFLQARAKDLGVTLTDDEAGRLVIYRPTAPEVSATVIERGRNVLRGAGVFSLAERFSQYECRGTVLTETEVVASTPALVRDYGVTRPRRKVIVPGRPLDAAGARRLCEWEALTRIGRGQSASYTLAGWYQDSGELWRPGILVDIIDARLRLDRVRWLITDVTWSIDSDAGRKVDLRLQPLQAFLPYPTSAPRTAGRGSSYWLVERGGKIVAGDGGGSVGAPADDDAGVVE